MGYPRTWHHAVRIALLLSTFVLTSLVSRNASAASATLYWTSPSDGSATARVYYYDLRISTKAIAGTDTLGWWNAATPISMGGRTPSTPGATETILLGGLVNGAKYYAILKSADSNLNWSGYSNLASFTAITLITAVAGGDPAPEMVLGIPRPTPTSGRTEVNLDLPRAMVVRAGVYDAQGRRICALANGMMSAGTHLLRWDGRVDGGGDAASGVYWIRATSGPIDTKVKLVVVR